MGAIQSGSSKVLTEGKLTARVGDSVLVTAAEVAAAVGSKKKPPTPPKNTGVASDTPLPPSSGGAGGSYEPALDYEGNLQPGVPGSVLIELDSQSNTYSTLQDYVNLFTSPGLVAGGEFTANSTHLSVADGQVLLRIDDDDLSAVRFYDFEGDSFLIPQDNDTYHIGVKLVDGKATLIKTTEFNDFDKDTGIPLGVAVKVVGEILFIHNPYKTSDAMTNVIQRLDALSPTIRDFSVGGLEISTGPNRSVLMSAGRIWARLNDFDIPARDSAVDGMLTVFYNANNELQFSGTTQWDNSKFNNTTSGTLQNLGLNKYAVLWFFAHAETGRFGFAYGTGEYNSVATASEETLPAYLTSGFRQQALFLGRIIFQNGASTPARVDSAFSSGLPILSEGSGTPGIDSYYDSSGVITGGNLTVNVSNNQTFDCSNGLAVFMNFSVPGSPTQDVLEFGPFTGVSIPGIGSRLTTYIGIDNTGSIVQQGTPFTATQRRSIASLGLIVHSNLVNINATNIIATTVHAGTNQLHDLMEALGPFNVVGNQYSANGANLQINKSSGRLFRLGSNFQNNNADPHNISIASQDGLTFRYRLSNGTEYANTNVIDPGFYESPLGTRTSIPGANRYSVQRIYLFQSGLTRIQYGQAWYNSMAEAEALFLTENFVVEQNISDNGVLRGFLIVQNNGTNLANTSQAKFISASKFGVAAGGSAPTTVIVGNTVTSNAGSNAVVTNSGTSTQVILDFSIPRGATGNTGPQGPQGPQGNTGPQGPQGLAATISVGNTTTVGAGNGATVTNSGNSSAAVFNFTIPAGPQGATGNTGPQGPAGAAATINVGNTATGAPGTNATVTNSGNTSVAVFNFTIPRGATGNTGPQGPTGNTGAPGAAATITLASTLTGSPGTQANVQNLGNTSAAVFQFTVPAGATGNTGAPGNAATIALGTVSTGAAGSNVVITNSGNSSAAVFNFTIPRGDPGISGTWGSISGNIATQTDLMTLLNAKANTANVVLLTTDQTVAGVKQFSNNLIVNGGNIYIDAASSATNSNLYLRNESDVPQGVLYWDRGTDSIRIQRYAANGTSNEGGEIAIASTGTQITANLSVAGATTLTGIQTFTGNSTFNGAEVNVSGATTIHARGTAFFGGTANNTSNKIRFVEDAGLTRIDAVNAGASAFTPMFFNATAYTFRNQSSATLLAIGATTVTAIQTRIDRNANVADATNDLSIGNGTHELRFHARLSAGSYNPDVQAGDKSIIYTNGTTGTGAMFIGPWSATNLGSLRLQADGQAVYGGWIIVKAPSGGGIRLQTTTSSNSLDLGMGVSGTNDPDAFIVNRANGGIAFYANNVPAGKINANGTLQWTYNLYGTGWLIRPGGTGDPAQPFGSGVINISGSYGGGIHFSDSPTLAKIWTQNDLTLRFGISNSAVTSAASEIMRLSTTQYRNVVVQGGVHLTSGSAVVVLSSRDNNAQEWHLYNNANVLRFWSSTAGVDRFSLDTSGNESISGNMTTGGQVYVGSGWVRNQQSGTGWFSEPNGGGIFMQDSTWIRTYNGKPMLIGGPGGSTGDLRLESTSPTITWYDTDQGTTHWLHCNGNQHGFLQNNSFAWGAYRTPSNDWGCVGNIIAYASDRRLKTNIMDVPYERVNEFFERVRIRQFDWDKKKLKKHKIGFEATTDEVGAIAQEMQEVFPKAVKVNEAHNPIPTEANPNPDKPDFLTIDWEKTVPLLIAEIQMLRKRVTELENKP